MKIYYSNFKNCLVLVEKVNNKKWKYRLCISEYEPFLTTCTFWGKETKDYIFIGKL